jgi:hypothetical protein
VVRLQPVEAIASSERAQFRTGALAERHVEGCVKIPKLVGIRDLVEVLGCELANRLEHPVAVSGAAQDALVDQGGDRVDVCPQISSAASSVQPPANTARRANRSCSNGGSRSWLHAIVARSVRWRSGAEREAPPKHWEPLLEAVEQTRRRERLDARCSQLDCEWQAVEAPADLSDLAACGEVRVDSQGTLHEQLHRLPLKQRTHADLPLAVDCSGSRLVTSTVR